MFSFHLPVAYALPGKHDSQKVHLLYLNVVCLPTNTQSPCIGNESVPKIITNDTMIFFLKLQSAF